MFLTAAKKKTLLRQLKSKFKTAEHQVVNYFVVALDLQTWGATFKRAKKKELSTGRLKLEIVLDQQKIMLDKMDKVAQVKDQLTGSSASLSWGEMNILSCIQKQYEALEDKIPEFMAKTSETHGRMLFLSWSGGIASFKQLRYAATRFECIPNDLDNETLNPLPAEAGRFELRLKSRFRLKPVAIRLKPAEALRIVGYVEPVIARLVLVFNVFLDNIVGHISRRSAEITPSPKMLTP